MKSVFYANLRQGCRNPGFLLGILLIPILILVSQMDQLAEVWRQGEEQYYGFAFQFFRDGLSGDTLRFVLPVICALPYAAGFVDELKSGAVKAILPRSGRRQYLWGKILACAACGGLVLLLGILLSGSLSVIFLSILEQDAMEGDSLKPMILETIPQVLLLCLSGGLWASVGMCVSCLTGSRYVSYLSPFICYYLLIILYERYFPTLTIIYPKAWLDPMSGLPFGTWGAALWLGELLLLVMLLFTRVGERRLAGV